MKLLKIGDFIDIKKGHTVYAMVPKHFLYDNRKGDFELSRGCVTVDGDMEYISGKYIVYNTTFDGGSHTYVGHNAGYPDGHHVFCKRITDGFEADFYQTGSFSAMIKDF